MNIIEFSLNFAMKIKSCASVLRYKSVVLKMQGMHLKDCCYNSSVREKCAHLPAYTFHI